MRLVYGLTFAVAAALVVPSAVGVRAQDTNRKVTDGGIKIPGWQGQIDDSKENTGSKLEDAKLVMEGNVMKVTTGPALIYWNPKNVAAGNYTVKATFNEPQFQNVNTHPHPYGIFIGGNDLGTPNKSLFYCAAYGDGKFIARTFGPAVTNLNARGEQNPAIHKAAGVGQPVTQDIAVAVSADKVTCSINGTVVGTYTKADIVGAGKLKSTDGVYGIRFAHNTDGTVTGLSMSKN